MKLQEKIKKKVNDLYHTYLPSQWVSGGTTKVECPFCGWKGNAFLPNGVDVRKNARCPKCNSLERHRLYYLYLKSIIPQDRPLEVLHFAPEKILTRLFKSYPNIDYLSADIDPTKAMVKEDITRISFADNSFDIIFCSHVLEHIPDDRLAMQELLRVLKPGGFAIIQVPIKDTFHGRIIDKTYEDFSIDTREGRQRAFGQADHVRVYGRDFKDRIESAGFHLRIDKFIESLPKEKVEKYALLPSGDDVMETEGWIYHCSK